MEPHIPEEFINCDECNGAGWVVGVEPGHGCDRTQESCDMNCPIPIQVQEQCRKCEGNGYIRFDEVGEKIADKIEVEFNPNDVPF